MFEKLFDSVNSSQTRVVAIVVKKEDGGYGVYKEKANGDLDRAFDASTWEGAENLASGIASIFGVNVKKG